VTWLAYWRENVMGSFKYVFLAASSSFKGKADMAKYDKVGWAVVLCVVVVFGA
jgi:DNA topoisomerase I